MKRRLILGLFAFASLIAAASPAAAASPVLFTQIWLNGSLVRTLLPPAAMPNAGTDPFFMVPGTGGVAAVGPGTGDYHGGAWQVYVVTWKVTPYPLTSFAAIQTAQTAGAITITRNADADFRCPIQP